MDLNSGQAYYRPNYMMILILKDDRAARAFQEAIGGVYDKFYRHDFEYHHAAANCTGVSLDTLRSIGWEIPMQGPTGYVQGIGAYPYISWKESSFSAGKKIFDYYTQEQTRLLPRVGFEAIGNDLLGLLNNQSTSAQRVRTPYEEMLRDDVEAVVFVRFAQVPSSRAQGTYPISSLNEYRRRMPADRSQWKIVETPPRAFPAELREKPGVVAGTSFPASIAIDAGLVGIVGIGTWLLTVLIRRKKKSKV
jgi:hypothetical protein